MPTCHVSKNQGFWGSDSFVDGFVPSPVYGQGVREELRRGSLAVQAVINRLMREGRWEEAEEIMDQYDL